MSKRELSRYLQSLSKAELEGQVCELYDRLKEVREFYNFVFNPREDKLIEEAKFKISKEYFPPSGRKPKKRRSVAQKHIRNFIKLGVEPTLVADVMLYNIEIALASNGEKASTQDAFYKSMFNSFKESIEFMREKNLVSKFSIRIEKIIEQTLIQNWINASAFESYIE